MLSTTEIIGICLFELPEKDQAVIQRVITFGASQGKQYSLQAEATSAQIIVTQDSTPVPASHAVTVRIGEAGEMGYDLLLQRPLLVTKVMRAIDDAAQMYRSRPTTALSQKAVKEEEIIPPPQTETQPAPLETAPQQETTANKDNETEQVAEATDTTAEQSDSDDSIEETSALEPDTTETVETFTEVESQEAEEATLVQEETQQASHPEEETPQVITSSTNEASSQVGEESNYKHLALVVDDSAAIRKQLEIELRNANIKAEFAETGEEALEKSSQKTYDLVFLDIIMPGIDGYEVCRQMRARKTMKKTPIIMLSGKTSPLDEVQGVIAGASTYLTKPVKHEQFQQTLKRVSKWLTEFAR